MSTSFEWSVERTILEANPESTKHLVKKIIDQSQCPICQDYMFVPFITKCGHNFCYQCITSWLCTSETCPSCRAVITEPPYFNNPVQDTVNTLMDTLKSLNGNILPADIIRDRDGKVRDYKNDEKKNNLFKKVFSQTGEAVIDTSDGVARCSQCHWEVEGNRCPNCHLRLRNPYANGDDSEIDLDYEEEEAQYENYEDESDDSSFIDNRDLAELEVNEDGDSILSDGDSEFYTHPANPYDGTWEDAAFDDEGNLSSSDLEEAFERALRSSTRRPVHHAIPISEDDDDDDDEDEDLTIAERLNVISDSDNDDEGRRHLSPHRRYRRAIADSDEE